MLSTSMPLVGTTFKNGIGPITDRSHVGPPAGAGNSLHSCAPARWARSISVGVVVPGIAATPSAPAAATTASSMTGETKKVAPAATARRACSTSSTVPAPTITPSRRENSWMSSNAPGIVSVNSTIVNPPRSAADMASAALR
jgi:hypothetical protein